MSKRSAPDSEKPTKSGKTKREADDDSGSDEVCDPVLTSPPTLLTNPGL